jgi:flavin-dependent dehydrogenase
MAGCLRGQVPSLASACPPVRPGDTCTAAREICEVRDRAGAQAFLEKNGLRPGEMLARAGVDGGFSTLNVLIDENMQTVDLLAGSIADGNHASGSSLLTDLKQRERWVGDRLFGGSGLVPLRRPYGRLAAPGIALVGDAGCQVFPAHGSGTGLGLVAAKLLVEAIEKHGDLDTPEWAWAYQAEFQRRYGAVCAAYDVFRRMSQRLSADDLTRLIRSGIVSCEGVRAGLEQTLPESTTQVLWNTLRGAPRAGMPGRLLFHAARMAIAYGLYRNFPSQPNQKRWDWWSGADARLFGSI